MTMTAEKIDDVQGARAAVAVRPRALRLIDWRVLVGGGLAGAILHIALVLLEPGAATGSAFRRLAEHLPVNQVKLMGTPTPATQVLPFVLPDALYAFCRYDLSVDSLRVVATLPEPGWTLSLHTAQGDNFYVMPGQPKATTIAFVVVPGTERGGDGTAAPRRMGSVDMHVASPTREGLLVIRAPLKGRAYVAQTQAALAGTQCSVVKR